MDARAFVALTILFGLGVGVIMLVLRRQKHPLQGRLEVFSEKRGAEKEASGQMLRAASGGRTGPLESFLEFTRAKLLRAGLPVELRPFFIRVGVFALFGAIIGGPVQGAIGFFLGLLLGAAIPYLMIHMKFKRRMAKLEYDLPTALQFIVNALRAGHALNSALAIVGAEGPAGCREDFSQLNDSMRLGIPIGLAFQQMLHRTPSVDLQFMATAMLIQRETGGNLTEILDRLNSVVLERKRMRGQVKALTGQARMGGYVVGGLPFFMAMGMFAMNPKYLYPMFQYKLGHYLLGGAFMMQLLGFLVMRKIVNIKM
ncbi:MAG: type II secretion system F family protein [Candidatus Tectomicrobia bacterium]|nr:type II secretion system F family protein [Candidatus Tectomicrobia bacterium]